MRSTISFLVLYGLASASLGAEGIEYYVWTDNDGVTHASDTPPQDVEQYETRTLAPNQNVVAPPESEARDGISATPEPADGGSIRSPADVTKDGTSGADSAVAAVLVSRTNM